MDLLTKLPSYLVGMASQSPTWINLPVKKNNPVQNIEDCKENWEEDEEEKVLPSRSDFILKVNMVLLECITSGINLQQHFCQQTPPSSLLHLDQQFCHRISLDL